MNWLKRLDPRRSLTLRIILINLALIFLALGSLVAWTGFRLQKSIIEEAEHELELRALIVANGLREPVKKQLEFEESEDEYDDKDEEEHEYEDEEGHRQVFVSFGERDLKTIVDSYAEEMDARVTILDPSLNVRYSSDPVVPIHIEERHPEITTALRGSEQHDIRLDEWTGEERLFVAAVIGSSDSVEGLVQLSVPMTEIMTRVHAMWAVLFTAALVLTALFVVASIILGGQITRPLRRLTLAANRLAAGDLSTRLDMDRQDELGALAAAFDHMAEQISELLARERAFVANASHELRSPLTALQLRAELLQMTSGDEARRNRYLQEIREETEKLARLLQQLLNLNRAESGAQSAAPTALSPCLEEIVASMQPLADDAGVSLQADIPPDLPQICIGPEDCELVVRNLVDNAIKYTPAGGAVYLRASVNAKWVQVMVSDTGIGIPEADLPHIFERFYRVDKARDRTGSGLGLALVKAILDTHGGEIDVDSREGEGTTVTVRFRSKREAI
ncbi:MAG: HAMP domain-containing protein [Chloroflexi bacterium]|nr:HAMP domain-containing protein [Chloroflexota bacterium]